MTDAIKLREAVDKLTQDIEAFEAKCLLARAHMPGLATHLRARADELADRYPGDTNSGTTP